MSNLIKALQVFLKYDDPLYPTHCEHDVLHVCIDPKLVSDEDKRVLEELGFSPDEWGGFKSYKYGSA